MSEWIVYSKDGLTERCRLKKLEYAGSYMNERTVTATFEYHSEVAFEVFDYIVYRGERFELEAIPSVKKTSKFGYTYELRFVSLKYELERCEMRDIVPNDNGVTYPSPLSFSFTGSVRYLAERIQANLDSLYGRCVWTISVASEVSNEEKNITISQQNCWNALSLVNTSYGLDFSIKGRNVTIGKKQPVVSHVFQYGKGNGLYEIERVSDTNTGIVTKLRAYGSTRNLDYSYPKKPEWADSVLPVSFILSPLRLMLPSFKLDGKTDYIMANDSVVEEYGIRESSMIYEDIYPTITDVVNSNGDSIDEIMAVEEVDDSSPTFVIYLYDLGFDLESHLTTEDAQISMKSGAMQGYTFNISKIEKQADNTYKITLGRITTDSSNTGNYDIPNSQWGMSAGDKFVLLNILMPKEYIRAAEQRLLERAQEYLAEYGKTNFSYNIGLNDKFLKEHENIYDELIEGSKLSVYDEELGIREEVTIQSITIDDYMEDNILPQVKVTLNNKPSASTLERIQGKINELSDSASNSFSTQTELLQQYRKKLDKPFFDRLFAAVDKDGKEIPSTDLSTPISYIKARFSLASLGGLTMYLDDKSFNLPTIYDGLPIDSQTIYWENGVLKAKTGGNTLGSLTNVGEWADSAAPKDRIMVQKKGSIIWEAMDISGIGSASFENISESGEGNAYTAFELSEDKKFLTLVKGSTFISASENEDITGTKNFINGLQINGVELKYDSANNAIYIQMSDGSPVNFYATGGISMYGKGNATVKSIMDAIAANLDPNTLAIENGLLTVVGGGSVESITKQMVLDALGFTPYDASNPNGYITSATLDGYLPLTGGTVNGIIKLNHTLEKAARIVLKNNRTKESSGWAVTAMSITDASDSTMASIGAFGWAKSLSYLYVGHNNYDGNNLRIYTNKVTFGENTVYHAGNFNPANYLPLSGGTIQVDNVGKFNIYNTAQDGSYVHFYATINSAKTDLGYIGINKDKVPTFMTLGGVCNTIWHAGNDGSGSGLDADTVDNVHLMGKGGRSGIMRSWARGTYTTSKQYFGNGNVVVMDPKPTDDSNLWANTTIFSLGDMEVRSHQLAFGYDTDVILYRRVYDGPTYNSWKTLAFTDSNVASATKLQTPRTIWGQSFDGSKDINGTFRLLHEILDTVKIHKVLVSPTSPYGLITRAYIDGDISLQVQREDNESECFNLLLNPLGGNVGIGTTSPLDKLHVAGNLRLKNEDSYYGNYIYFGDYRYCYIGETTDDSMTIYASKGIQLNGKVNIASDTTIDGNLLVRGGITMYSTDGNVTPFLIDVQNWELIDSMSVTQVYTAHVTTLLKKKVKEFGEDVTELSKSLDSKIRTIKASLQNITSSSSVSAIGTALNTLYNSL